MTDKIIKVLNLVGGYYWMLYGVVVLLAVVGFFVWRRWGKRWDVRVRWALGFIVALLLFRLVFFWNPVAWKIYDRTLHIEEIGYRHFAEIDWMIDRFTRPAPGTSVEPTPLLAVGSSQTAALYQRWRYSNADFDHPIEYFGLVGMVPIDYWLWRDQIRVRRPEVMLLYLSEFDLCRQPRIEDMTSEPPLWGMGWRLWRLLETYPEVQQPTRRVVTKLVSDLFPEYRFGYLAEGYLAKCSRRRQWLADPASRVTELSDSDWQPIHIERLTDGETLQERWMPVNLALIDDFLAEFDATGTEIYIVEGGYHPEALERPANQAMHRKANEALGVMANKYQHVTFVPIDELITFVRPDFREGYHVNDVASRRFVAAILDYVRQKKGASPSDAP